MKPDVTLYDTTLRDGAQAEGINFSTADKLHIASRLDAFGIHYIEGGWPGSNPKDIEFFARAKAELKLAHARLAAFGSTRRAGVRVEDDPQVRLLLEAETPVVTIYGKTSLFHVLEVLRTTPEENLAMIADTVAFLKKHGREVIYDAEHCFDGFRAEPAYALACLQAARRAGADVIALCDTNGGSLPEFVSAITRRAVAEVGGAFGIHTHDDSGLGVANALAAVAAGAIQVQGTANGYGERNGNCNLTTVLPNLQLKMGRAVVPADRLPLLRDLSLYIDETANQRPNIRAPFVGQTSFAHKGGTHVNAVNKVLNSYEHIEPAAVGNTRRILVGELSGRANVMMKARELGIPLDEKAPETLEILETIKRLENEGYEFEGADGSFELLVRKTLQHHRSFFDLKEYRLAIHHLHDQGPENCQASVKLAVNGQEADAVAQGDGPVNALDGALRAALVGFYPSIAAIELTDYKVRIVDSAAGTGAKVRVFIESSAGLHAWSTVGVSSNIVEASWLALADSIEYHLLREELAKAKA